MLVRFDSFLILIFQKIVTWNELGSDSQIGKPGLSYLFIKIFMRDIFHASK